MDYEMTIYFRQKWKDSRLGLPVSHSSANQRTAFQNTDNPELAWGTMSDELFRKMNIAPGSKLPPGGRLGRRGNKNQVDSRLIEKIWRPDIYFDYEKHSTRDFGSANVSRS